MTPNDIIQPANTWYFFSVRDTAGTQVFYANYVIPSGSPFNIGLAVPTAVTTSNISYISPISLSSNNTFIGNNTFALSNGKYNAASCALAVPPSWCSGTDIAQWANSAWTACSNACTVYIPAGTYTATHTINPPVVTNGLAALQIDPGATINYTGSGDAIFATDGQVGRVNLKIYGGGEIVGTSAATSCVHLGAFSGTRIDDITCRGFTNGDGFYNQGANTVNYYSCHSIGNKNGVHNVGKVVGGVNYAPNAIQWFGGEISLNTNQGWFEDASLEATVGVQQNNGTKGAVFELNGTNGSTTTAQVFVQICYGCAFRDNYFEYITTIGQSPTYDVIIGDGTYQPGMTTIEDNLFITGASGTAINNFNATTTLVSGNIDITAPTNFFLQGALSPNAFVLCNLAPSATNNVAGTLIGVINTCMPTTSTGPGMSNITTLGGYQFNGITGYNQDLAIRTRAAGTNNINGYNAAGSATYFITDAGGIRPGSTVVGSLPSAASSAGLIFYVTDSTTVSAEGQTCVGSSSVKAIAISNGSVWKCF